MQKTSRNAMKRPIQMADIVLYFTSFVLMQEILMKLSNKAEICQFSTGERILSSSLHANLVVGVAVCGVEVEHPHQIIWSLKHNHLI